MYQNKAIYQVPGKATTMSLLVVTLVLSCYIIGSMILNHSIVLYSSVSMIRFLVLFTPSPSFSYMETHNNDIETNR